MGFCPSNLDQTILQINFAMKESVILDKLNLINKTCDEIEILYIKFHMCKKLLDDENP